MRLLGTFTLHTHAQQGVKQSIVSVVVISCKHKNHAKSGDLGIFTRGRRKGLVSYYASCSCYAVQVYVQNRTCEYLAPGWSERMVGTVPTNY